MMHVVLAAILLQAPEPPKPVQLTLDLGFVNSSGNSDVTTFNLGQKLSFTTANWVFTQTAKALYGETDGTPDAESYEAALRADRVIKERVSIFGLLTYYRDPFAGLSSRFSEGLGLAWRALRATRDTLRVETSLSMYQERNTADVEKSFGGIRGALSYKHLLGEKAFFTQLLEGAFNLKDSEDLRVNSETALTAPISQQIALKASYVVRYDRQPELDFEDTDRIFTTAVQIVFD